MSWYPEAIKKPVDRYMVGGSSHVPMTNPRRFCLHTAVSSGDSLFALFNTPGNAVAHFYVRENGKVEQYVNTDTRASANLEGNPDTISVESWDNGGKRETWTAAQVEACAQLAAWVHKVHGIPLVVTDASPGSRGVTWHRKGIDGNFPSGLLSGRKAGDEHWSNSAGKVCPFDGKIRGVVDDIIPRARDLAQGEDDMSAEEVWNFEIGPEGSRQAARERLREADFNATLAVEKVGRLQEELAEFRANILERDQAQNQQLDRIEAKLDLLEGGTG